MVKRVIGLDIGGANIKAAHSEGATIERPLALWKNPKRLPDALADVARRLPASELLAVTMTGELCDCFPTQRAGVNAILDAVETGFGSLPMRVWQSEGRFVDTAAARTTPQLTGAANWLALAEFAGRFFAGQSGLVIDVGSTTTDIIPVCQGRPVPRGRTDKQRLLNRELVYTGARRTPLCALLGAEGAAEFFATMHDVHIILGNTPEDDLDCDTADGRPATRPFALARLARMVCADREKCTDAELHSLAEKLFRRQCGLLQEGCRQVAAGLREPGRLLLIAGSGEFLARAAIAAEPDLANRPLISLGEKFGPNISRAACAYAVMMLAREEANG
jgi:probable H4MPT-linked C1 transfer pathway protein